MTPTPTACPSPAAPLPALFTADEWAQYLAAQSAILGRIRPLLPDAHRNGFLGLIAHADELRVVVYQRQPGHTFSCHYLTLDPAAALGVAPPAGW